MTVTKDLGGYFHGIQSTWGRIVVFKKFYLFSLFLCRFSWLKEFLYFVIRILKKEGHWDCLSLTSWK